MVRAVLLTVVVTLVAMFGLAWFSVDPHQTTKPTTASVLGQFDTIGLSGYLEVGPEGHGPELRRWTGPVHVRLIGTPDGISADDWASEVAILTTAYGKLPGLGITVDPPQPWPQGLAIPPPADGAITIATLPSDRLIPLFDSGLFSRPDPTTFPNTVTQSLSDPMNGCVLEGDRMPVLHQETLWVRGTLSEGQRHDCVVEKLSLALGFAIAASAGDDIFSVEEGDSNLNPVPRMAMALVYDPALKPGMTRDQALAAAKTVLAAKGLPDK